MEAQTAKAVLLVRPAAFGFNPEAARSNVFSKAPRDEEFAGRALAEFDQFAEKLADAGVEILILEDSSDPPKPDAIFPNNWFSTHAEGTLVVYPMATEPRRLERRVEPLRELMTNAGFQARRIVNLSAHEQEGRFLEGTGSLVLDRPRRRAFASRSNRTHAEVIADLDQELGYETFLFDAFDPGGRPIYHTNVLLSLGAKFAVLCLDAIAQDDRNPLLSRIEDSGRAIIELSFAQLRRFGCNLLQIQGRNGPVIALSQKALESLQPGQLQALERHGELVAVAIPTIEAIGGGSVRCMIAEIHLPRI